MQDGPPLEGGHETPPEPTLAAGEAAAEIQFGPRAGSGAADPPPAAHAGGTGSTFTPIHSDRTEKFVAVNRSDLEEIGTFATLQEGVGATGVAFATIGLTEAVSILVEHSDKLSEYAMALLMCTMSIIFGAALIVVAIVIFNIKRKKIDRLIPKTI